MQSTTITPLFSAGTDSA